MHQEALNAVLKDVADRLREKQNASKRAAAAAGRKDGRDADGMDVDEPGGGDGRNKGRKYVWLPPPPWPRPSVIGIDDRLRCLLLSSVFLAL